LAVPEHTPTPVSLPPSPPPYRGRFAPSPTGPLHLGSVVTALASFLDARAHQGTWLVRIEDLDPPREDPAAASTILHTLERLGLHWDETVTYQSTRNAAYEEALNTLQTQHLLYHCRCSRSELGSSAIYPGTCRHLALNPTEPTALRCRVPASIFSFSDRLQGLQVQQLDADVGDFVLLRKEGLFSYQLAVVVDDGWQGITDIVRGIDLLDSTPRQLFLQHGLQLPCPRYAHVPVVVDEQGQKLSKQQKATPITSADPATTLITALHLLHQQPSPELAKATVSEILAWAIAVWQPIRLTGLHTLTLW
jgi:glutamyl-Q tRNA(Asp) synthetase